MCASRPSTGQSAGDSNLVLPPVSFRTDSSYSCRVIPSWTSTTGTTTSSVHGHAKLTSNLPLVRSRRSKAYGPTKRNARRPRGRLVPSSRERCLRPMRGVRNAEHAGADVPLAGKQIGARLILATRCQERGERPKHRMEPRLCGRWRPISRSLRPSRSIALKQG